MNETKGRLLRAAVAIGAISAAVAAWLLLRPRAQRELERRELPGFSLELPARRATQELLDYANGSITYADEQGRPVVMVVWYSGEATGKELDVATDGFVPMVGGGTVTRTTVPGSDGTPVATSAITMPHDRQARLSILVCGKRMIQVTSVALEHLDDVHAAIVRSLRCTPDRLREAAPPGLVRIAIALPGWIALEKLPTQITLINPEKTNVVMLREVSGDPGALPAILPTWFATLGGQVQIEPTQNARVPFAGTIAGGHVEGWATQIACPGYSVLVVTTAGTRAQAETLVPVIDAARCLAAGEAPPTWPFAP